MKMRVRWILLAAALGLMAGAAVLVWRSAGPAPSPPPSAIGGAFALTDQNGRPVTQAALAGKWSAVFFGYTFCPDVCPTTLQQLGAAEALLGPAAQRFQVIFISIDPQRDTPAVLRTYLSTPSFPRHTIGLTGTAAQVSLAAKAYRVYYARVPQGSSYVMDHSAVIYLMDPEQRFVKPLDLTVPPAAVAAQIRQAMGQG